MYYLYCYFHNNRKRLSFSKGTKINNIVNKTVAANHQPQSLLIESKLQLTYVYMGEDLKCFAHMSVLVYAISPVSRRISHVKRHFQYISTDFIIF